MNVLKTIFTRCLVIWLGLLGIYASVQVVRGAEPLLSWIGLALTALSLLPFFFVYLNNKTTVTRRQQSFGYTMISGLGLVICMAVSYRYQQAAGIIHIWAGITFIGWVVFVRACLNK